MGLFSFLKNAGAKMFTKEEAKKPEANAPAVDPAVIVEAEKRYKIGLLRGIVEGFNFPVEKLEIDIEDDKVILSGEIETQADKEKVILAVGNVDGIAYVEDHITVTNPTPEAVFYEVQKGDSLSKIAKAHYGNAMKYPAIFEANKPMLQDPDKIYPGQMLRIPPLD